jgi:hypothetical protein
LVFSDEERSKSAFADVRSNDNPANWLLFTYSESAKNTLDYVGSGTGGVEELKSKLRDDKTSYGLVRVTDKIDNSVTVKFVLIVWVGEKVPFVKKAQVTTHKGSVTRLFGQYHNDIHANTLDEISESLIMGKVSDASGTAHHVKDKGGDSNPSPSPTPTQTEKTHQEPAPQKSSPMVRPGASTTSSAPKKEAAGAAPKASSSLVSFKDEEAMRASIKAVRDDKDPTDWMLMGYEGNTNTLKLVATGQGDLDELVTHLKDDQILYGLYRTTDTIDNTVAVKFVLIIWIGESVPIIRKARIATHKGDVTSFLGQYHVDVSASNLSEINEEIVKDLVQRASGTASHVKK